MSVETYRIIEARLEDQARSIGQVIHDGAGQVLALAYLALAEAANDLPGPVAARRLLAVRRQLDGVEEYLRNVARELKPRILDELGLEPALTNLGALFTARYGVPAIVEVRLDRRFPDHVESSIYRIVQEALTNVGRHARAAHVWVRVSHDGRTIRCSLIDDGVGFDAAEVAARNGNSSLGLLGVRQRVDLLGGRLWIRSSSGAGTRLTVTIPTGHLHDSDSPRR